MSTHSQYIGRRRPLCCKTIAKLWSMSTHAQYIGRHRPNKKNPMEKTHTKKYKKAGTSTTVLYPVAVVGVGAG